MRPLQILLFLLTSINLSAQSDIYQSLDTIDGYVNILISVGPDGYFVNEKKVDKRTYDGYKRVLDNIGICKPCWI